MCFIARKIEKQFDQSLFLLSAPLKSASGAFIFFNFLSL